LFYLWDSTSSPFLNSQINSTYFRWWCCCCRWSISTAGGAAAAGGALVLDDGVPLAIVSLALDGSALGVGVDVGVPAASPARLIVDRFKVTLPLLVVAPREDNGGRLACVPKPDPLVGAMDELYYFRFENHLHLFEISETSTVKYTSDSEC
jgi:hypothetical protein